MSKALIWLDEQARKYILAAGTQRDFESRVLQETDRLRTKVEEARLSQVDFNNGVRLVLGDHDGRISDLEKWRNEVAARIPARRGPGRPKKLNRG